MWTTGAAAPTPYTHARQAGVCCSSSLNPNPNPHPNPNPNPNPIQAGVLFLIAGLVQIIACIILLVQLVAAINHADDSSYCDDRYSKCTSARVEIESIYFDADSLTLPCTDGWCYQDPDDLQDTQACSDAGQYDSCKTIHKGGKAVVTGILVIVFGATAAFLLIAGLLNTLGGVYCFGAKKAIEAASKSSPQAAVAVVGTQLPQA